MRWPRSPSRSRTSSSSSTTAPTTRRRCACSPQLERDGVHVVRRANGGLSAARMTGVEATSAPLRPCRSTQTTPSRPARSRRSRTRSTRTRTRGMAWGDVEIWGELEAAIDVGRRLDPWLIAAPEHAAGRVDGPPRGAPRGRRLAAAQRLRGLGPLDELRRARLARRLRSAARRSATGAAADACSPTASRATTRSTPSCGARHPQLFAARRRNWLRSRAPLAARARHPARRGAAAAPTTTASRWFQLANEPGQFLRLRARRRAERPRAPVSPRVTVLLAGARRRARSSRDAVASVLAQTFDGLRAPRRRRRRDRRHGRDARVVRRPAHPHPAQRTQRRPGAVAEPRPREARGEYVARIDADDCCLPRGSSARSPCSTPSRRWRSSAPGWISSTQTARR